ncbi:MAG: hypothetical protein IPM56_03060 [Ignavibacteriales bacterium]|nr:MAG: hypothetical protein IPM56_03060 [Ignavibacteriales bacterium]
MNKLFEISEVSKKILNGDVLILAADENLLRQLPEGNWIGGTIPYFMDAEGGIHTKDKIFVNEVPSYITRFRIKVYDETKLPTIGENGYEHGYSMIIIPSNSSVHVSFAENSHKYNKIFHSPLVGWIAGIDLNDIGKIKPKVFNGLTKEVIENKCIVLHLELPANKIPNLDIINLFEQGNGDTITFDTTGFDIRECFINGQKKYLSDYLTETHANIQLPLVADYCGASINTSFQTIDNENNSVSFYAPVFKGVEYKIAKTVSDYVGVFEDITSKLNIKPVFTCNCILNYIYSGLEGKRTGSMTGPMTFGEIAYQLLNQTLVYLTIEDAID